MPAWQGQKYSTASCPGSDHNSRRENKMSAYLCFNLSLPLSVFVSVFAHRKDLSELLALPFLSGFPELLPCRNDGSWTFTLNLTSKTTLNQLSCSKQVFTIFFSWCSRLRTVCLWQNPLDCDAASM